MQINIGVQNTAAPLQLDVPLTIEELVAQVTNAIDEHTTLELTGTDGSLVFIPAHALAYVKIAKDEPRHVGFAVA